MTAGWLVLQLGYVPAPLRGGEASGCSANPLDGVLDVQVPELGGAVGTAAGHWNDSISSLIVVSGTWQLYENADFGGAKSNLLTPGYYPWVEDGAVNIANDSISSFQVISFEPDGV